MVSIFDDDGNGELDFKEIILGLEVFRDNTFEEKLKSKLLSEKTSKKRMQFSSILLMSMVPELSHRRNFMT